jgi:hypothetical protein
MTTTYDIQPLIGYGELKFGLSIEETIDLLGDAEEIDHLDTDDQMNTIVLHYWEQETSIFFEGVSKTVLSCFETDHLDATLYGEKVFEMTSEEVIKLMADHGYKNPEIEEEEGETRITFEDLLIDFFFDGDELLAVNWGVLVNEAGEIETDD